MLLARYAHPASMKRRLFNLAAVVRSILSTADVRTDQCDILRVYHAKLIGAVRPRSDGRFEWSVTDVGVSKWMNE
jgi:hypothetical protein